VRALLSFASGVVFAVGICVSGMSRQSKVLGFLDVAGDWDPSLLFVMGGAVGLHAIAWHITRKRNAPILGGAFPEKPAPKLDAKLLGGAAVFGVGWGLGGFCPGPGVVACGSGAMMPLVFVAAMALGMFIASPRKKAPSRASSATPRAPGLGSDAPT
jgi:uncharacterized membrane protein YedE/YeeE